MAIALRHTAGTTALHHAVALSEQKHQQQPGNLDGRYSATCNLQPAAILRRT